ncbi:MAG: exodeoxyribonuclease VII large subunit [Burkholderiaceae bacterium]|nr:exodeoxyribonuclease VII large subunit [Burkholderiaceae bacterium]
MVDAPDAGFQRVVWGVAGLVHAIGDALAARFGACTVRGELSGYTRASSGHCYFSLKDANGDSASIRCAMFKRSASLLQFQPADGQQVQLRGRVAVYEPRGELQFIVEAMQRSGEGSLYEQFLRIKQKLETEGLFDAARKRPIATHPRRVGIVTSLDAAALHDVASALARRSPHVELIVYPSLVQGSEAPAALVAAIEVAGRRREVDTLLVCRGGGSMEDLWSFNDERVVRAIVVSPIPVISGVGHETDTTLADFAADLRAPTPTAAAELCAPSSADNLTWLAAAALAMRRRVHRVLETEAQRVDGLAMRSLRPAEAVRRQLQTLELWSHRLASATRRATVAGRRDLQVAAERFQRASAAPTQRAAQALDRLEARLRGLDPAGVLRRGYAWLSDDSGRALVSTAQLSVGQSVQAVLADGVAVAQVTSVSPTSG